VTQQFNTTTSMGRLTLERAGWNGHNTKELCSLHAAMPGSGTILIAAERTGRNARAIELDPRYVDVAVRRWQKYAGKAATLAATGQSFEDVEEERLATTVTTASPENQSTGVI
jgi:hypothetical protein